MGNHSINQEEEDQNQLTEEEEEEEEETEEETDEEESMEEQEEEPILLDQMDGNKDLALSLENKASKYPTLSKQLKKKPLQSDAVELIEEVQQVHSSSKQSTEVAVQQEGGTKVATKQYMLTPYIPPTFPVVMLHLGRGRYLSGGYVDGAHVIRIQDNYPKKYEDERRRFVKLNISQFLDLVACFGSVSGEVNRLKTAKQSSINEEDRKHIGRNIYVSIFRSTDENLFVDIRQFYVPEDDFAKGNCRLVPTKAGISLRVAEWEQLTKVSHHMKTFMPAIKNATRCISTHEYQEHIEMCPHCTPNWMC